MLQNTVAYKVTMHDQIWAAILNKLVELIEQI